MDLHSTLARVGVRVPDILLPRPGIDLNAWAVVACDQFTSQPEYWQQVRGIVGDQPSTLNLIFPEVYLGQPDSEARISAINSAMRQYLDEELFESRPETMVLVRRETHRGAVRWGLMAALDLEHLGLEGVAEAREGLRRVQVRVGLPQAEADRSAERPRGLRLDRDRRRLPGQA